MTGGMFCANRLSQYQEILSKTRMFETGKYSKLGRTLYHVFGHESNFFNSIFLIRDSLLNITGY